jgi:GNAT superfamily N-acetyltransferase
LGRVSFAVPVPLAADHKIAAFDCGVAVLDDWLKRRALANQVSGASRTYVALIDGEVAGYYAIAASSVSVADAPGRVRRNMPEPIPVMMLGRLATDRRFQGQGVGAGLLKDAVQRTLQASQIAGIRSLVVDAIDDAAVGFYQKFGFAPSPTKPRTLFLMLSDSGKLIDQVP